MKLYLWNDDTYDSLSEYDRSHTLDLVNDEDKIVTCGYCQYPFIVDRHDSCPDCGKDMIFPRAEW